MFDLAFLLLVWHEFRILYLLVKFRSQGVHPWAMLAGIKRVLFLAEWLNILINAHLTQ
jgi:hypothetical protein